uniref:Uncharacterized protein n=1 Tax=Chromera velia CCMP2878 TaxID=1169474 RepID=A0A0G4HWG1_9ALVE|mmetsp:Transcript_33062/g.65569  ORF Transcript_33062/g.65569 Transcript_33062/m.65569 type:complete len:208 (-) Transcript_33062:396-1019(-)|eukprot:Cvel_9057.t1-p1 / transcript=Cvel_9057.t1 / gene=Cvel_9057 / organism=Chromera_velia_CCMP2878 / gene_product=hypothetical protein / transcript_product=hypothetical protein / location=Cvel_scaffold513:73454-74074(-) / protein_length=207 / sequence_SO=supercontig / SO=protein_coding / is_pseudo=false
MDQAAAAMLESNEEFRKQFDRNSATFHNGDPTPVGVGGKQLPKGLEGERLDWENLPEAPPAEPEDFGPEVERLMAKRNAVGDFKKAIEAVCKPIDNILKLQAGEQTPTTPALIEKQQKAKLAAVSALEAFLSIFSDDEERKQLIESIAVEAKGEFASREAYGDFLLRMKRHQSAQFNAQKSLLQDIKKAKQEYKAAKAAEQPPEEKN